MGSMSGILITVRSGKQGAEMVSGKTTREYQAEIATLRINPADLTELGAAPGQTILLKSSYGQITVTCRPAEGPRGFFFLPLGPVANRVFSSATAGTGVPDWKGLPVTLMSGCGADEQATAGTEEEQ